VASEQSSLVSKLYRIWLSQPEQDELITNQYGWDVLTTEPGGVDYIEADAGGVEAMWATPKDAHQDRVLLCMHGGGFIGGSMYTHRKMFGHIAKQTGARALIINYRLLPEGMHPKPVDDTVTAYRWLLDQRIAARHIAFCGDSAGGALSVTAQLRAREQGLPLPAATILLSPWVDFEVTGGTMQSNAGKDALFNQPWIKQLADDYRGSASERDPLVTPLHADLTGFGPIYVQVGDQELLLDDSRRLVSHAQQAGVDAQLEVFDEMQHTFQMMAGRAPEADEAIHRLAEWARPKLGLTETEPAAAA